MSRTALDLDNHLMSQMERLIDEDLEPEELEKEINRAKALTSLAQPIIAHRRLILDAEKFKEESGIDRAGPASGSLPKMLAG